MYLFRIRLFAVKFARTSDGAYVMAITDFDIVAFHLLVRIEGH